MEEQSEGSKRKAELIGQNNFTTVSPHFTRARKDAALLSLFVPRPEFWSKSAFLAFLFYLCANEAVSRPRPVISIKLTRTQSMTKLSDLFSVAHAIIAFWSSPCMLHNKHNKEKDRNCRNTQCSARSSYWRKGVCPASLIFNSYWLMFLFKIIQLLIPFFFLIYFQH